MSCLPEKPIFRLLDAITGWDLVDGTGLEGFADETAGVELARLDPGAVDPAEIFPWIPPARLARGCGRCEWWLVTPQPSRLLRLVCGANPAKCDPPPACVESWIPIPCAPRLIDGVAVAARGKRVAVADRGAGRVYVRAASGEEPIGEALAADPGPLAFTPWGELLVVSGGTLLRFDLSGAPRGAWPSALPGVVDRLAVGDDCAIWLVTRTAGGTLHLWRATREAPDFVPADPKRLSHVFPPTGLTVVSEAGFCLRDPAGGPEAPTCCFTWYGRPTGSILPALPPPRAKQGQLLAGPIDSGKARCRWHRVRLEATVPAGTSLEVAVASAEDPAAVSQGDPLQETGWETFPAGAPHPGDWQSAPRASLDFLVRQPPGRYLFLRLRLTGDGYATPVVHRVRIDLPRSTSLEYLPPVYREEPRAEDFSERFLSLFDASIEDLDAAIERLPALLDPAGVPDEVLPWLGSFLDLAFESAWSPARRRQILAAAPHLYRARGTREGLTAAIRLVLGVDPVIEELGLQRAWGAVSRDARLGSVRLFSRARARFTLGSSALCEAPLKGFGDPDLDPLAAGAWRFRVAVPALLSSASRMRERLERLLESQKPAHTIASVRVGGTGLVVGSWSTVGVDTVLAPLPAPVLGGPDGNVRLGRATVLWTRRAGSRGRLRADQALVGVHTVAA